MEKNINKGKEFNKNKSKRTVKTQEQESARTKWIIIIVVLTILAIFVAFFRKMHDEKSMQVGMASNQTDISDVIVEITKSTECEGETEVTTNTTTTAMVEEETISIVTTITTISVTLKDIDTLPWGTRIGAKYQISKNDFVQLCNLVGREYGADFIPVQEKAAVVQTVMNRVNSPSFPNTIQGVIEQPGQYEGFLSRGYYTDKVNESVRLAVLGCLNGEFYTRYTDKANVVPYKIAGECDINEGALFYWGDGLFNHFYQTYEEFSETYTYFLNHKEELYARSKNSYMYITGQ